MAGAFRIAEGYVEVTADQSSYDRSMDRLKSEKHQVKVGLVLDRESDFRTQLARLTQSRTVKVVAALDKTALSRLKLTDYKVNVIPVIPDAALQRIRTQLDRLTADRNIVIRPQVDTRVAADELRNLTARRVARIGVNVDTRVAADDLANLTRRRTLSVVANANTTEARARIDALARTRRVDLDVNVRGGALSSLASLGSSSGGLGGLAKSILSLKTAAVGAFPMLASLGESLIQMGPAAAVAVPAVLSLVTAFAAIKIGTGGVGGAIKAALAPATSSGSAAASSLRAVQNAQEALGKATQGVRDAEVNAAAARVKAARDIRDAQQALGSTVQEVADANHAAIESVASAERDLTNAQKAAKQAQEDLTQARKDAASELEDLANQLADSQLSQRQDVLALQDAQAQLNADKAAGSAVTAEQMAKDQLAYDQAVQQLAEQQLQTKRLTDQNTAAAKAGVEGSSQVVAAKQGISDANQAIADKTQALADAQHAADEAASDGADRISKAERDLSDARAAATKAATDGARSIADANQAVADAARSLADAQTAGASAVNKTADALAKLAPNARSFVAAIVAQRGAWSALRLDVQNALFQGLSTSFTAMANSSLPVLHAGLVGTAGVLSTMARNAMSAVTNLAKTGTLRQMFSGITAGLKPLSRIPGQFVTALAQLSTAASPAFKRLTTAAGNSADSIMKKLDKAFKNGSLTDAINKGIGIAKAFGKVIGDAFGLVGNVMKAASAGGGDALGMIGALLKELRQVTASKGMQEAMTSVFKVVSQVSKLLAGSIGKVVVQLFQGFAKIAPAISKMLNGLGDITPLLGGILLATNPILGIFVLLAPILEKLAKPISKLIGAVGPLLDLLSDFAGDLMTALAPVIGALIDVLSSVLGTLGPIFKQVAPILLGVIRSIAGPLANVIKSMIPMIKPLIGIMAALDLALLPLVPSVMKLMQPISQLAIALANLAIHILTPLLPLVTGVATVIAKVLGAAISLLVPILTTVIGWITKFTTILTTAVDWVVAKFQWLYDTLVGHSIIPDLVNAIIGWFGTLWNKAKTIFATMVRDVVAIWNGLWSTVRTVWNRFWSGLSGAISSARSWIGNAFSGIRNTVTGTWTGLWNDVRNGFTIVVNAVTSKISSFASGTKRVFTSLRDSLGSIWSGIEGKFSSPVKFMVNTVYNNGIRKMWDTIASKVGLPQLPQIKLGFNTGGVVPGTGTRDTVDAKLTPGERVLSLPQVAQLGGHRGIDAMLGHDHPAGTGGNPTTAQERKIRQPIPHYGLGGIVDTLKDVGSSVAGAVSSGASWAKNLVVGGLKAAAQKAITSLVQPLINRIPSGGVGDLMKGMSSTALKGILGTLGKQDAKAVGGPAVQRALAWAKGQGGKPYQWAGNGNPSWDCSGLMSAIESVIRGEAPHRRWATGAFSGSTAPPGWVRNLVSPFMIGITNAGVGHTAGTLAGVNVESRGGAGVINGPHARGYNDPLFTSRYGFQPATTFDSGGLLAPGATVAVNKTKQPERILSAEHTAKLDAMLDHAARTGGTPDVTVNMTVNSLAMPSPTERRAWSTAMAKDISEAIRKRDRGLA